MDPKRWQRIKTIYRDALDRPADEREAFVRTACHDDSRLANEILRLLGTSDDDSDAITHIVDDAGAAWSADAIAGKRLGPYRLIGVIGEGGMGQVFLAERADDEFEQRVAIKMANWMRVNPDILARFQLERQILAGLEHPNIARLLDGGRSDDGVPYLVMEYVDGESILEYASSESLSIGARLDLFLAICDAVQYAHGKLVVHRDLKPSNVLVTKDATPKLLDFGIAKLLEPGVSDAVTRAEVRIMTPEYASPEQLSGEPVTTATDVYGLGLLLYQLLTGTLPFDLGSRTSPEIRDIVCHSDPTLPSRAAGAAVSGGVASRLRGDLDNIILMALRRDPERRYATVKEFADDVRHYRRNQPVRARGDSWAYRSSKFLRRHRSAVTAATLVVTAGAALAAYYTDRLATERDRALHERQVAVSTTDFLVDLFDVSDPARSEGEDITAREVLDAGAERIRDELKDDDEIRGRMLQTIGRVYERLGHYEDARELMEEAVELNRAVLEPTEQRFVDGLNELAWLHYRAENWPTAKAVVDEALALQVAAAGGDTPEMVRTLNMAGTVAYYLDDFEGSIDYYDRALAVLSEPEWRDDRHRATTLNHLGIVYGTLSRYDEAEAAYQESLGIRLRAQQDDQPGIALAYSNLATHYINTSQPELAREPAGNAYDIDRRSKGEDHVDVAFDLGLLAAIERDTGNYAAALEYLLEAAAIWESSAGATHSRYARALDQIAEIYRHLERLDDAESAGRRSLSILDEAYGPDHTLTSDPLYTLGKIYLDQSDYDRARDSLERALAIREASYSEGNQSVWQTTHILAKVDLAENEPAAAVARAESAISQIEQAELTNLPVYQWLKDVIEEGRAAL